MSKHCDVSISVNGEETFFLNEKIISAHSGKLKKMIKQEKRIKKENIPIKNSRILIEINNFPGGSNGFELVSRFCYNNGRIEITFSNICFLYCSAVFLEMSQSLLMQTESFLEGIFYWSLNDILVTLKSCAQDNSLFAYADSYGLLQRLICALLAKIAQNPDSNPGVSGGSNTESPSMLHMGADTLTGTNYSTLITSGGSSGGSKSESPRVFHVTDDTSTGMNYRTLRPSGRSGATSNSFPDSNPGFSGGSRIETLGVFRAVDNTSSGTTNYSTPGSSYQKSPVVGGSGATPDCLQDRTLARILASSTSSSSYSSPASSSPTMTSTTAVQSSSQKQWWFDDLSSLPPAIIEKLIKNLGSYGKENNSIILTRFILHYLKKRITPKNQDEEQEQEEESLYGGLADTAIYGVIFNGSKSQFSCRGLLRILRTVSGFGVSKICRGKLERLIGSKLDEATLDDLLITGQERGDYYDVKLVLRLIRIFVNYCNSNDDENGEVKPTERMKKVGKLIDKYMAEISPDHNLKMSKFLGVAQSLPDSARDCFDGVYKAIDMYLQSHPSLTFEERSKICRCLNYEKLSLEACKELAKNPRIPPTIAIQALKSQTKSKEFVNENYKEENEDMKVNIERMQTRVIQLEKACKEMKGQMSLLVKHNNHNNFNNSFIPTFSSPTRALPRLC